MESINWRAHGSATERLRVLQRAAIQLRHCETAQCDAPNQRVLVSIAIQNQSGALTRARLVLSAMLDASSSDGYRAECAGDPRVRGAMLANYRRSVAQVCASYNPTELESVELSSFAHSDPAEPARWAINLGDAITPRPFDPFVRKGGKPGRAERIARRALRAQTAVLAGEVTPSVTTAVSELDSAVTARDKEREKRSLAAGRTHTPKADTLAAIREGERTRGPLLAAVEAAQRARHAARAPHEKIAASEAHTRAVGSLSRHDALLDGLRSDARREARVKSLGTDASAVRLTSAVSDAQDTLRAARELARKREASAVEYSGRFKARGGHSRFEPERTREEIARTMLTENPTPAACLTLAASLDAAREGRTGATAERLARAAEGARMAADRIRSGDASRVAYVETPAQFPVTAPDTTEGATLTAALAEYAATL